MSKKYRILLISSLSLFLICALLFGFYLASYRKKTVMKLAAERITEDVYAYYMSSYKYLILSSYKETSDTDEFWDSKNQNGVTYEEYFTNLIDYYVKQKLAASALFNDMGLTLSDTAKAEIEEALSEVLYYTAQGDPDAFNALAKKYGVDYKGYKNALIFDYKVRYLYEILYTSGTNGVSEESLEAFFNENYSRVKIVLIRTDYDFERLENDPSTPKTDASGNYIKHYYDDTEKAAATEKIENMKAALQTASDETFDLWWENDNRDFRAGYSPNGYYLSKYCTYDQNVVEKAQSMTAGESAYMDFDGYTLFIRKYENVPGDYGSPDYKNGEWFNNFTAHAAQADFSALLDSYAEDIKVYEKAKGSLRLRDVIPNGDF